MTARFGRVLSGIAAVLVLSFVISACVQVEVESQFEEDGSGRHSIASTLDRTLFDESMLGGEFDGELDFDAIEREAEAAGLETERIDDAGRLGVRISTEVEENEDLGQVLADLFAAMEGPSPPAGSFQGGFTQSGSGIGGTTYRFELSVDGDQLFPNEQADLEDDLDEDLDMDFDIDMLRQFINLTYTVSMPGEITEHNGTPQGPGRVQWDLPLEGSATFIAESEEGSSISLALIAGIVIGIAALALIIVGGVILMRGQRTPTSTPEESPDPSEQPVHPVTGQPDPVTEVEIPERRDPRGDQSE